MKYIVLVLFLMLGGSRAQAQLWAEQPVYDVTAADKAQLPFSVTVNWAAPEGWTAVNYTTWDAIWPRNAAGAWYRPLAYTQTTIYQAKAYPWQYRCTARGLGFDCRDLVRGITRRLECPATLGMTPMWKWRSLYNSAWRQQGLFWASQGPFTAGWYKTLNVQSAVTTADGQRVNCQYGPITAQGPGTALDIWVFRRPGT